MLIFSHLLTMHRNLQIFLLLLLATFFAILIYLTFSPYHSPISPSFDCPIAPSSDLCGPRIIMEEIVWELGGQPGEGMVIYPGPGDFCRQGYCYDSNFKPAMCVGKFYPLLFCLLSALFWVIGIEHSDIICSPCIISTSGS